jgi:hypothetical protein
LTKVVAFGMISYPLTVTRRVYTRCHLFLGHFSIASMIFACTRQSQAVQIPSAKYLHGMH